MFSAHLLRVGVLIHALLSGKPKYAAPCQQPYSSPESHHHELEGCAVSTSQCYWRCHGKPERGFLLSARPGPLPVGAARTLRDMHCAARQGPHTF